MAPRDEAMLVHMLHTALQHRRPGRDPLPARRGRRRRRCPPTPQLIADRHRRDPARGRARRARRLRHRRRQGARRRRPAGRARARRHRRRRALRQAAGRRRCSAQLAAEHDLLVTVEEGVLAGGFGSRACGSRCPRSGAGAAHPARRPARPLRDPRRAALLHEEVGFTRRADRRAHRGRGAGPARLVRLSVSAPSL